MLNIFIYKTRLLNYINIKQIRSVFYNIVNKDNNLLNPWWVIGSVDHFIVKTIASKTNRNWIYCKINV